MVSLELEKILLKRHDALAERNWRYSTFAYHFTITAWSGSEQGHTADFHIGAQINVGKDHKVGFSNDIWYSFLTLLHSFMAHPETLLPMPDIDDPIQRFLSVVKFYLSGWHIKPPLVIQCE